jgi:Tfp pilus assembly protein PilO
MTREKWPVIVSGVVVLLIALSGLAVTYPSLRELQRINIEMTKLEDQAALAELQAQSSTELARELDRWNDRMASEYRPIPRTANIAGLIRELSPGEGGAHRTITTGEPQDHEKALSLPVIIESYGTFTDVFDLLRRVEELDRLVRLRRVTITHGLDEDDGIDATIQLDAYFHMANATSGE